MKLKILNSDLKYWYFPDLNDGILIVHSDETSVWRSFCVNYPRHSSELLLPASEACPSPRASAYLGLSLKAYHHHRTQGLSTTPILWGHQVLGQSLSRLPSHRERVNVIPKKHELMICLELVPYDLILLHWVLRPSRELEKIFVSQMFYQEHYLARVMITVLKIYISLA